MCINYAQKLTPYTATEPFESFVQMCYHLKFIDITENLRWWYNFLLAEVWEQNGDLLLVAKADILRTFFHLWKEETTTELHNVE